MIIFIVGLPGSGKTRLGKRLQHRMNGYLADDFSLNGDSLSGTDGEPRIDFLRRKHEAGEHVIVTDSSLCLPTSRDRAEKLFPGANWLFFANDPEACLANVRRRDDGRDVEVDISVLSRLYKPGEPCMQVWRPEEDTMPSPTMPLEEFTTLVRGLDTDHERTGRGTIGYDWEVGGTTGGDCWGSEPRHYSGSDGEPDTHVLDELFAKVCPAISYLQYKRIRAAMTETERRWHGYYGNSTDYAGREIKVGDLYALMVEMGLL